PSRLLVPRPLPPHGTCSCHRDDVRSPPRACRPDPGRRAGRAHRRAVEGTPRRGDPPLRARPRRRLRPAGLPGRARGSVPRPRSWGVSRAGRAERAVVRAPRARRVGSVAKAGGPSVESPLRPRLPRGTQSSMGDRPTTTFDVTCPCCKAILTIDGEVRAVLAHREPPKTGPLSSLDKAMDHLRGAGARREAAF